MTASHRLCNSLGQSQRCNSIMMMMVYCYIGPLHEWGATASFKCLFVKVNYSRLYQGKKIELEPVCVLYRWRFVHIIGGGMAFPPKKMFFTMIDY